MEYLENLLFGLVLSAIIRVAARAVVCLEGGDDGPAPLPRVLLEAMND
jgi:hypothetical protein